MNLPEEAKLDELLNLRADVPPSLGLEQKIINAAKIAEANNRNKSFDLISWINENFAFVSFAKTGYALSAVLILGLIIGSVDYSLVLEPEYQVVSELFYSEEVLL